jgi:hypothetical protein
MAKTVKNVVYSALVFIATSMIGVAAFGPVSPDGELSQGTMLAIGVSIVITIVFSMWFSRRNKSV